MNKFQQTGKTKVLNGSILAPETAGLRFVLSLNNTQGKAEGNPLLSIFDKKWKKVREESRGWYVTKTGEYKLGAINSVATQSDVWVIGMLCQGDDLEVDAVALKECLKKTCALAKFENASIHISNVLTKLIPELNDLVKEQLLDHGVNVYYYQEK